MNRDLKKWKPFNSVVPASELLKNVEVVEKPILSKDEIIEFEEKLKTSLYLKTQIKITYIDGNKIKEITDYVVSLDPLKKNVHLKSRTINFRQICNIK